MQIMGHTVRRLSQSTLDKLQAISPLVAIKVIASGIQAQASQEIITDRHLQLRKWVNNLSNRNSLISNRRTPISKSRPWIGSQRCDPAKLYLSRMAINKCTHNNNSSIRTWILWMWIWCHTSTDLPIRGNRLRSMTTSHSWASKTICSKWWCIITPNHSLSNARIHSVISRPVSL